MISFFNKFLYRLFTIVLFVLYAVDKTLSGFNPLVANLPFIEWLKEPKQVIYSVIRVIFDAVIISIILIINYLWK